MGTKQQTVKSHVELGWGKVVFIALAVWTAGYYGNLYMHKDLLCRLRGPCTYPLLQTPIALVQQRTTSLRGLELVIFKIGPELRSYIALQSEDIQKFYEEQPHCRYDVMDECAFLKSLQYWNLPLNNSHYAFVREFPTPVSHGVVEVKYFGFFSRFSSYVALFIITLGAMLARQYYLLDRGRAPNLSPHVLWRKATALAVPTFGIIYALDRARLFSSSMDAIWLSGAGIMMVGFVWLHQRIAKQGRLTALWELLICLVLLVALIKGNHYTYCAQFKPEDAIFRWMTAAC